MIYVWGSILVLVNAAWLALVAFGLPGNWLIVLSTGLLAWWQWDATLPAGRQMFHPLTLVTIVGLALIGEVLEFFAGVAGATRAGGTRRGAVGAFAGSLTGAIVGTFLIPVPLLGSLIGAAGGAGLGALLLELSGGRRMNDSMRAGVGAGVGRFFGSAAKLAIGVVIWLIVAVAAFWP